MSRFLWFIVYISHRGSFYFLETKFHSLEFRDSHRTIVIKRGAKCQMQITKNK